MLPIIDSGIHVQLFDGMYFQWRKDKKRYEYTGKLDFIPEIFFISFCILEDPVIIYEDCLIPLLSKIYDNWAINVRASDYDLAYNVIPRLQKNNIQTAVISNADIETEEIADFDKREADRRKNKSIDEYWKILREFSTRQWQDREADVFMAELKRVQVHNKNGYLQRIDMAGKYINVFQGERLTVDNPACYENTLWLFGACLIQGIYVNDSDSLGSFLRKRIDSAYCIRNMGTDWRAQHMAVRDQEFKRGDIVVIQAYNNLIYQEAGRRVYSLTEVYQQCQDLMEHVLDSLNHIDGYLMGKIADKVYEILKNDYIFPVRPETESEVKAVSFGTGKHIVRMPEQLSAWLKSIKKYRGLPFERTGAIVMNCNPFTLGHRYLIEKAYMQVDRLLIFVVEEDRSFFKYKDRFRMVQIGTEDLPNAIIIPSGKYIISAETLPGYFDKDDNPEITLDASLDLQIFAEFIAKELNVKVRFAGDEPSDLFTRQYNLAMGKILPEYGIDFVEVPRKKLGEKAISASYVRKLMEKEKYEEIKNLVMPQVYKYLKENILVDNGNIVNVRKEGYEVENGDAVPARESF